MVEVFSCMFKKLLSFILCFCLVCLSITPVFAVKDKGFNVKTQGEDKGSYVYKNDTLDIKKGGTFTISNNISLPTAHHIIISAEGSDVTVILNNVNIDTSSMPNVPAINVVGNCKTTIILANGSKNTLKSGLFCAGLQKSNLDNFELSIGESEPDEDYKRTGKLSAFGGNNGAGIGGGQECNGSRISINNSIVFAEGGDCAAGVGGGSHGNGSVTVKNSIVSAKGKLYGAGIGGGFKGNGHCIEIIENSDVVAIGGEFASGIGGGANGAGGLIAIKRSKVRANGGSNTAAIGGCFPESVEAFIYCNGDITAMAGENSVGIGYLNEILFRDSKNIIMGGSVIAQGTRGFDRFPSIDGYIGEEFDISVYNVTVTGKNPESPASNVYTYTQQVFRILKSTRKNKF